MEQAKKKRKKKVIDAVKEDTAKSDQTEETQKTSDKNVEKDEGDNKSMLTILFISYPVSRKRCIFAR